MNLDQAVDHFLSHLRVERALADNTLQAYGRDLSDFIEFVRRLPEPIAHVSGVGESEVRRYLQALTLEGRSVRTIARRLSCLKTFFRFLVDEGLVAQSPAATVEGPKLGRPLPHASSVEDMKKLLDAPDQETLRGQRDRAMLALTYAAGLRVSEVRKLVLGDVDHALGAVQVVGKGDKPRIVPVGQVAMELIDEYLDFRRDRPTPAWRGSTALFPGKSGRPMSRVSFWRIVRRYAERAGIDANLHPHALRHSYASHLLSGGADLRSVQLLLGHVSIATTEIYTHLSAEHVRTAFETAHPRAKHRRAKPPGERAFHVGRDAPDSPSGPSELVEDGTGPDSTPSEIS